MTLRLLTTITDLCLSSYIELRAGHWNFSGAIMILFIALRNIEYFGKQLKDHHWRWKMRGSRLGLAPRLDAHCSRDAGFRESWQRERERENACIYIYARTYRCIWKSAALSRIIELVSPLQSFPFRPLIYIYRTIKLRKITDRNRKAHHRREKNRYQRLPVFERWSIKRTSHDRKENQLSVI